MSFHNKLLLSLVGVESNKTMCGSHNGHVPCSNHRTSLHLLLQQTHVLGTRRAWYKNFYTLWNIAQRTHFNYGRNPLWFSKMRVVKHSTLYFYWWDGGALWDLLTRMIFRFQFYFLNISYFTCSWTQWVKDGNNYLSYSLPEPFIFQYPGSVNDTTFQTGVQMQ